MIRAALAALKRIRIHDKRVETAWMKPVRGRIGGGRALRLKDFLTRKKGLRIGQEKGIEGRSEEKKKKKKREKKIRFSKKKKKEKRKRTDRGEKTENG